MKKVVLLAPAFLAGAAFAGGGTTVDLTGIVTDGAAPVVISIVQDTTGPLEGFSWDLNYTAFTPSWGSELAINLFHVDSGFSYTLAGDGDGDTSFGWGPTSGLFASAGTVDVAGGPDDTSGEWLITITDDFDDFGADGEFLDSSTVTINKVPAPGALALLGMAGLMGRRRRR